MRSSCMPTGQRNSKARSLGSSDCLPSTSFSTDGCIIPRLGPQTKTASRRERLEAGDPRPITGTCSSQRKVRRMPIHDSRGREQEPLPAGPTSAPYEGKVDLFFTVPNLAVATRGSKRRSLSRFFQHFAQTHPSAQSVSPSKYGQKRKSFGLTSRP